MKHVIDLNIFEFAVDKNWFKKNPKHRLSNLNRDVKFTKTDIDKIQIVDEGYDYKVFLNNALITIGRLVDNIKDDIIEFDIANAQLGALILVKLIKNEHIKAKGLVSFKSINFLVLNEIKIMFPELYSNLTILNLNQDHKTRIIYSNNKFFLKNLISERIRIYLKTHTSVSISRVKDNYGYKAYYIKLNTNHKLLNWYLSNTQLLGELEYVSDLFRNNESSTVSINAGGILSVDGIPSFLIGIGLGYKIYKKVLISHGFGRSKKTSDLALGVWKRLIQDKDFYHVIFDDDYKSVAVIYKNQSTKDIRTHFKNLIASFKEDSSAKHILSEIDPKLQKRIPDIWQIPKEVF